MDAQIFWIVAVTSSCYTGIHDRLMGNCGFTLAPCAAKDKPLRRAKYAEAEDIRRRRWRRIRLALADFPDSSTRSRAPEGHQLRRLHRRIRAAHLRDGERAFEKAAGRGTICRAMA